MGPENGTTNWATPSEACTPRLPERSPVLACPRRDGFASLQASYEGGQVTTRPFRFLGSKLRVNARADFGRLGVEVLDQDARPVPGFTRAECLPMQADKIGRAHV